MPTLYLIPNVICEQTPGMLPANLKNYVTGLRTFFVEGEKAARRLLRAVDREFPIDDSTFHMLNEHSNREEIDILFSALKDDVGVISEAGVPCVADPGAELVRHAHGRGWKVVAIPGPSSILLALMASGLNGQNFAFNGYLPKDNQERLKRIRDLERRAVTEDQAQIFMETPYRNDKIFEEITSVCRPDTLLCVACNLNAPDELVKTVTVGEWKKRKPDMQKRPAIFILGK